MLFHDGAKDLTVGGLLGRDSLGPVPGQLSKVIKAGAHIQGVPRQIGDGQIHGAAPAMAGIAGDVALIHQQDFLFVFGVKFLPHAHIVGILGPADKVPNGAPGTVGVENHDSIAHFPEFVGGLLQALGRLVGQDGIGRFVAIDHIAHKIMMTRVADI